MADEVNAMADTLSFEVDGEEVNIELEWGLGGDLKFIWIVMGLKTGVSECGCPLCTRPVYDWEKHRDSVVRMHDTINIINFCAQPVIIMYRSRPWYIQYLKRPIPRTKKRHLASFFSGPKEFPELRQLRVMWSGNQNQ